MKYNIITSKDRRFDIIRVLGLKTLESKIVQTNFADIQMCIKRFQGGFVLRTKDISAIVSAKYFEITIRVNLLTLSQ